MENDKNYFLVGIFIIAIGLAGLSFTLWLTSANKGDFDHYRIRFAESVAGLRNNGTVKYRGVDVGNVENIEIDPENSRLIIVDIRVRDKTPVKADTTATLQLQGITGDIYVELTGGNQAAPKFGGQNKRPELKSEPSSIDTILTALPKLLEKTTHAVDQINKVFSDDNVHMFNGSLHRVAKFMGVKPDPDQQTNDGQ